MSNLSGSLKSRILNAFRLNGLSLRSETTKYLVDLLSPLQAEEQCAWLDKIIDSIQKQNLRSTTVEKIDAEKAAKECCQNEFDEDLNLFHTISAFEVPKFKFSLERKKYLPAEPSADLFGGALDKAEMFRHRYHLLHQRTSRHSLFTPSVLSSSNSSQKYQLQPIEFILGMTSKQDNLVVLGLLSHLSEGQLYLEDITGSIPISLKETVYHGGIFTENCFVLAQGYYQDGTYHIEHLGMPPPEPAKITRTYFGNVNFFGGPSATNGKSSNKLKLLEEQNSEGMLVFLSDVWLDQFQVMEKLRILFAGYCETPPIAFILMGNFLSDCTHADSTENLKQLFKALAEIIREFPNLVENSRFVFVPGPNDCGGSNILPRPQLSRYIQEEFIQRIPTATFTTNPTRIQYGTKEIVILREDILTKMCRNSIHIPPSEAIPMQFAKTLVSQGHLCPLPGEMCPIYWTLDHSLYLYPLPDVVVVGDRYGAFTCNTSDCTIINPGPFSRNNFNFKVLLPASMQVEDSEIGSM